MISEPVADDEAARLSVSCDFRNCDTSIVGRVLVATVDQLCADGDVAIDVLESIEFPLLEMVDALHEHVVSSVVVTFDGDRLGIRCRVDRPVVDAVDLLGASDDVIGSFFDVAVPDDPYTVVLTGSLR